jgi:hypothetical protein
VDVNGSVHGGTDGTIDPGTDRGIDGGIDPGTDRGIDGGIDRGVDPAIDGGGPTATRRQLDALVAWADGMGDPDDPGVAGLRAAGLIVDGVVHPALNPVVAVLRAVEHRVVVRRWAGGRRPIAEVLVGAAGVLVLPGGHELDAAQQLRWHPRRTAVARVVAELVGVPAHHAPPALGTEPRRWSDLIELATRPGAGGLRLVDARWSRRAGERPTSVLAAAWGPDGGVVEVVPVEDRDGWVACRPRHPVEVWTGMTTLVRPTANVG